MTQADEAAVAAEEKQVAPRGPQDLRPETWRYIVARTTRGFGFDDLPDAAASLTYYGVLSIFPALIAIVAGFVTFGDGRSAIETLLKGFDDALPGMSTKSLMDALDELAKVSGIWPFILGTLLTVWTVSRYVGGFSRAMNRIYGIDEGRGFMKLKPQQLLVSVAYIIIVGLMGSLIVLSGSVADAVGEALRIGEPWLTLWSVVKWPLLVLLAVLLIGLLYYSTPNRHITQFRWLSFGAVIALTTLIISSAVFFVYVLNFSNYDKIYRSLAGALIALIWLWIANLALLFGAEFDAQVERGRQLQAGIAAEDSLQLEVRDDRLALKRAKLKADLRSGGVEIRHNAAPRAPR